MKLAIALTIMTVIIGFILWRFPYKESYDAVLVPDQKSDSEDACDNKVPSNAFKVYLGDNLIWTDGRERIPILKIGDREVISLNSSPEGVLISGLLYDLDGHNGVVIRSNHIEWNTYNYFKTPVRHSNHDFFVYDSSGRLYLGIDFLNPRAIRIWGIFVVPGSPVITVSENGPINIGEPTFQDYSGQCAINGGFYIRQIRENTFDVIVGHSNTWGW